LFRGEPVGCQSNASHDQQRAAKVPLADHAKVGARSYVVGATLDRFDKWFTTSGITPSLLEGFREKTTIEELPQPGRGVGKAALMG
jgi:DeoR/GlpR family transcriptional regulator of sugar metabolism